MNKAVLVSAMGLALAATMTAAGAQEMGRVLSSTPVTQDGRAIGYDVQYEYGGKQFSARLPYDPGPTIQLQVAPVANGPAPGGQVPPGAAPAGPPQEPQARILREVPPTANYPAAPAYGYPAYGYPAYGYPAYGYPAYGYAYPYYYPYAAYPRYYWPPVSLSLGFGYVSGGHGGHRHR
ncbi:hypothetical protein GCM10027034_18370 [Ramlibacter solisilvae]|uniref:hypothetical protein n=1 Tax=Ramlibacter tataouinensis TaxID=94132 RepID=UPI0009EF2322|nr:hypothetical protein [Ramlibacter tataouinensis]